MQPEIVSALGTSFRYANTSIRPGPHQTPKVAARMDDTAKMRKPSRARTDGYIARLAAMLRLRFRLHLRDLLRLLVKHLLVLIAAELARGFDEALPLRHTSGRAACPVPMPSHVSRPKKDRRYYTCQTLGPRASAQLSRRGARSRVRGFGKRQGISRLHRVSLLRRPARPALVTGRSRCRPSADYSRSTHCRRQAARPGRARI